MDDDNAVAVAVTGNWRTDAGQNQFYGCGYRHDRNQDKGRKQVQFELQVSQSGRYFLYLHRTKASNGATNVPVDIVHAGGIETLLVNQRTSAGDWVRLGEYAFSTGELGQVTIRTDGTDGYVNADAVALVKSPVPADVNRDGAIDNLDIAPFIVAVSIGGRVDALTQVATFLKGVPDGSFAAADVNQDGLVNNLDITDFVDALVQAAGQGRAEIAGIEAANAKGTERTRGTKGTGQTFAGRQSLLSLWSLSSSSAISTPFEDSGRATQLSPLLAEQLLDQGFDLALAEEIEVADAPGAIDQHREWAASGTVAAEGLR